MSKTVLVTGAGRGLGLALTKKFLELGFRVFAGRRSNSTILEGMVRENPGLSAVFLDVTDDNSVNQAFSDISKRAQGLDILINNAGLLLKSIDNPLEKLDFQAIQQTFEVNTFGPLRVVKEFLPLLEQGTSKLIINISSDAGSISDCTRDDWYDYCMSKAALNMQSKILQNYLRPKGFKVLAIHPGWMRTDMGGPAADIEPEMAAEGITRMALRDWKQEEGIYFDYQEKPLCW